MLGANGVRAFVPTDGVSIRLEEGRGGLPHGPRRVNAVWTGRLHYWSACPVLSSPSIQVPWRQHSSKKNDSNQWKWLNGPTQLTHYELPWHGGFIFRWIMEHCLTYWPLVGVLILPQDRHCVRPELVFMNYTPSESVNLCFCSPPLLQKTPFAW